MQAERLIKLIKAINKTGLKHHISRDHYWKHDLYEYDLWNKRFSISLDKNICVVMDHKRFLSFKAKTPDIFKALNNNLESGLIFNLRQFIIDYC